MTKERLVSLSLDALRQLASRQGILAITDSDRDSLIDQILEAIEEERSDRQSADNMAMKVKEKKFGTRPEDEDSQEGGESLSLPDTYNETTAVLLLRDPLWAFAYWDIKRSDLEMLRDGASESRLFLRVFATAGDDSSPEHRGKFFDIPLKLEDRSWYINLPATGSKYFVQLVSRRSPERVLCSSNVVASPRVSMAPETTREASETLGDILVATGIQEPDDPSPGDGIPQRIISLLDTQYLHLQG